MILASTSVPFILTTVQVPNVALTHKKWITVWASGGEAWLLLRKAWQCLYTPCTFNDRVLARGRLLTLYGLLPSLAGIAGHRHQIWCHRHRHSGIRHLSPVQEPSVAGLGPIISVPDWPAFAFFIHSGSSHSDFQHLQKLIEGWKAYRTPCTSILLVLGRRRMGLDADA